MKKLLASLLALLPIPAFAAPAAALPDADPAMWVVKDKDTTIYLFGTFHALDGKRVWLNDEVKTAFDKSDELVLEIITPENQAEMVPVIAKYAIDNSGRTLASKLSPATRPLLSAAMKRNGLPEGAFDSYQPFFASMALSMLDFSKMGLDPKFGPETVLREAAGKTKKLDAVETVGEQLSIFASMPEADQVKMLEDGLKDGSGPKMKSETARMLKAWSSGDAATVATMIQSTEGDSPKLYRALFTDRNARWAQWIERRMEKPGTVFFAVGAGHLAGPNSVQNFLKQRRIVATRVPHAE